MEEPEYHVGRNAKENDELFKQMPKSALWFHLDEGPSAHVYLVSKRKPTKKEIKEAAVLVRKHSKGQGRVIYLPKSKLKLLGGGTVELLVDPKIA